MTAATVQFLMAPVPCRKGGRAEEHSSLPNWIVELALWVGRKLSTSHLTNTSHDYLYHFQWSAVGFDFPTGIHSYHRADLL